jgi:hypothetical protein
MFAELDATSNFTFLTGGSHPEELVERAAQLGLGAIAVADENSVAGIVRAHAHLRELARRLDDPESPRTGSMDGLVEEDVEVETGHHDFTTTPVNGMLFLTGQGRDGCSRVEKLSEEGELSLLYDLRDAFGDGFEAGPDSCHCNSIQYNPSDDSISVSCLVVNAYIKISAAGELLWVLGGSDSHFSGDVQWNRNHGHQMVSPTRILFFNNNGLSGQPQREAVTGVSSLMLELELDLDERTATRSWTYDGGESSQTLGDVQRLPNGNTHVTYSNAGLMHQVNADGNRVQEWDFPRGTGYARHRESLYGPPPSL